MSNPVGRPKDKELEWYRSCYPGLSETSLWRLRIGLKALEKRGGSIEPYMNKRGKISVLRLFEDAQKG